jgi:predicted amidophosphoribosyltransferase
MPKKKKVEEKVVEEVSEAVTCPVCGKPVGLDVASCPHCGAEFETDGGTVQEEEMAECPVCGKMSSINASACPHCGAEFEEEEEAPAAQEEVAEQKVRGAPAEPVSVDETAECPVCGKQVSLSVSSCPYCGAEFEEEEVEEIIEVEPQPVAAPAPSKARPIPKPTVEVRRVEAEEATRTPSSIMDPQVIGISLIALGIIGSQIAFMIDWYWTWVPPIGDNLGMFVAIPAVIIAVALLVFTMLKRSASGGKKVPRSVPGYMLSIFLFGIFALILIMLWNPVNSALQNSNTTIGAVFVVLLVIGVLMIMLRSKLMARAAA